MTTGKIVFINGISSSGKTSIVRALQDNAKDLYLEAGIDKFIWMLPKRFLDCPLWGDVFGQADKAGVIGHDLIHGMHHAIADHVLVEPDWVKECVEQFADLPAYLIGIECPLDVLEQRERKRKNRTLGQAKKQFPVIHKYVQYDLVLDTSLLNPEECALSIISRLQSPPDAS